MKIKPAPFVLASILSSYPSFSFEESISILMADPDVDMEEGLKTFFKERTAQDNILDLQSEYIYLFDHSRSVNPLYETEYGRHRVLGKGNELSDIAGFYHAFGFELDQDRDNKDMLDHVSIELEFYALLLMKQIYLEEEGNAEGVEILLDGRKKFLESHLGRFVWTIASRPGVQESEFYRCLFGWVANLVDAEVANLGLKVEIAEWTDSGIKEDEVSCDTGAGKGSIAKEVCTTKEM